MRWLVLIPTLLVPGCGAFTSGYDLKTHETGYATQCLWFGKTPFWCREDPSRSTINDEALNDLIEKAKRYRQYRLEELRRRAL